MLILLLNIFLLKLSDCFGLVRKWFLLQDVMNTLPVFFGNESIVAFLLIKNVSTQFITITQMNHNEALAPIENNLFTRT